jgi:ATP-dependent exoDNAse (exonuclease V) beta subunit
LFPEEFHNRVSLEAYTKAVMMCQKLKDDLKHKYGESCVFYPEIAMTCDTQEEILGSKRIYGIVDLLVLDKNGIPHLIDFKTSTKPYNKFHETKKQAYTYQLAVYERILSNYGIRTDESTSTIVPIQIKGMQYD